MTAAVIQRALQTVELGKQAHRLIDEFLIREKDDPDRAWESMVELRELIDQLSDICPPRAFRSKLRKDLVPRRRSDHCCGGGH
jgi:hypothetical protein